MTHTIDHPLQSELLDPKKIDERIGYKKRYAETGEDFRAKEKRKRLMGQQNRDGNYGAPPMLSLMQHALRAAHHSDTPSTQSRKRNDGYAMARQATMTLNFRSSLAHLNMPGFGTARKLNSLVAAPYHIRATGVCAAFGLARGICAAGSACPEEDWSCNTLRLVSLVSCKRYLHASKRSG